MVLYRKKTRDPEKVVRPEDYRPGLIVWVENGSGTREQYVCTSKTGNGNPVPYDDYMRKKEEKRNENIRRNTYRPRDRSRPRAHPSVPYMGQ